MAGTLSEIISKEFADFFYSCEVKCCVVDAKM